MLATGYFPAGRSLGQKRFDQGHCVEFDVPFLQIPDRHCFGTGAIKRFPITLKTDEGTSQVKNYSFDQSIASFSFNQI